MLDDSTVQIENNSSNLKYPMFGDTTDTNNLELGSSSNEGESFDAFLSKSNLIFYFCLYLMFF